MRADGPVELTDLFIAPQHLLVIASYSVVRGVLRLPEVESVSVDCAPDEQEFCACGRLRVDQCSQHAFCNPMYGRPEDVAGRCVGPLTLAGCTRSGSGIGSMSRASDPEGRPWILPNGGHPDQPGWRDRDTDGGVSLNDGQADLQPKCPGP